MGGMIQVKVCATGHLSSAIFNQPVSGGPICKGCEGYQVNIFTTIHHIGRTNQVKYYMLQ